MAKRACCTRRSSNALAITKLWFGMAQQGLTTLGADATEAGLSEIVLVFEELGRASCPAPLLGAVAANLALAPGFAGLQRLIVCATEHVCVLGGHRFPAERVEVAPVDAEGRIDLAQLEGLLEGAPVTVTGSPIPLYITYRGGDGNDVELNTQFVINGTPGADNFVVRKSLTPGFNEYSTDSGATFTSPDQPSIPHVAIARITAVPLSPGGRVTPLGTLTFSRQP